MKVKDIDDPDSLQRNDVAPEKYDDDDDEQYDENDGEKVNEDIEFLDNQVNEVIRKRREDKDKAHAAGEATSAFPDVVDERLGEDFEDSPWVPPSVELAWEYRLKTVYHGGKAKRSKIKLTKATDLGLGVPMYFLFIKTFALTTFFMTLFSLPPLFFAYFGHRIPQQDHDTSGFYRLSIGNIGYDPESSHFEEDSQCKSAPNKDMLCFHVYGIEFTYVEIANILTICEIIQVFIFFIGVLYLQRAHSRIKSKLDGRTCSVTDYSIMVENIPPDTTEIELIQHFSTLYPLDRPDWKGRSAVDAAEPVRNCGNSGFAYHMDTWIAEVTIFKKIGSMIRSFKSKQKLTEDLLRQRATMKMYNTDTCHADGPNPKKYSQAEYDMISAGTRIDELTVEALKQARKNMSHRRKGSQQPKNKVGPAPDGEDDAENEQGNATTSQLLEADALMAFVVFNYAESMARCVEDYTTYSSFPMKLLMPSRLKFKGNFLKVSRGPEPDEIVWENLEISQTTKILHRITTAVVAFILLLIGFAFILQSGKYKAKFDSQVPELDFCDTEIPALYAKTYDLPSDISITIPDTKPDSTGRTRKDYDTLCTSLITDSFYAIYTVGDSISQPLGNYSIYDGCKYLSSPVQTDCPTLEETYACPCITLATNDVCQTLSCSVQSDTECTTFKASTIAGCYCMAQLQNLFEGSVFDILSEIRSVEDGCREFYMNYAIAIGLTITASLFTVAINVFLKNVMKALAKKEYHNTLDEENSAMVAKVFLATYINMAIVALVAYGYLENKPDLAKQAQLFNGDFSDFNPDWYAQVGSYLVLTFAIQTVSPLSMKLLKYYILNPLRMAREHPKIQNRSSHKYPMQADVNELEHGGPFDMTVNNAQLLALLFFSMTYSAGLPIMTFMTSIAFTIYFNIDKLLLLRYYAKPPKMGDAIMQVVLKLLPWAGAIRLAVACWMYSNEDIFPYSKLNLAAVPSYSLFDPVKVSNSYNSWVENHVNVEYFLINTGSRIPRGNVFPIFVFLVIVLVILILTQIFQYTPLYYVYRGLVQLSHCWNHHKKNSVTGKISGFELLRRGDPLRAEMAPYTGDYYQYLTSEFEKQHCCSRMLGVCRRIVRPDLNNEELANGWRVSYQGAYKVKMAQWLKMTRIAGATRSKGSMMRTYELICQHGCHSYNLYKIPNYRRVMLAIKDGLESIAFDIEHGMQPETVGRRSVIENFNKRRHHKATAQGEKARAKQKMWEKKEGGGGGGGGKKGGKVVPDNDDDHEENRAGLYEIANSDDGGDDEDV